ncbi:bifunctional oligoribonuclease/PAP phosphatase NrnA [Oceanobacillus iheyensis]|uniref:DHH family phosphoesterase n=1 Tax=Oceanobacillus iheyensis TaxID=182710 RepID=UPI00363ECADD
MTRQHIIEAIKQYNRIIIHRHVRPDPDAIGSQAGLKHLIKNSFPKKEVYIVGETEPSLKFLDEMDVIREQIYKDSLVIVCDTANQPRIDDQRYTMGGKIIKIDHHPETDTYGDIQWVDTNASSVSEMIVDLATYGEKEGLKLNNNAARLLYAGIVGDTGRFKFPSTTKKTFQLVAELVAFNFDRSQLYNELYSVEDKISRLSGHILQNFELSSSGLCTIKLTAELLERYGVSVDESSQLVQVVGDVKGIKAWVFFIEESDQIRTRLRSKGPVVNEVASQFNGGGHPLASGATVYSWEEAKALEAELEKVCEEYEI